MSNAQAERAINQLYESDNVRSELRDEEASLLLTWGESQLSTLADHNLPDDQFDDLASKLRALLVAINLCVGRRKTMPSQQNNMMNEIGSTAKAAGYNLQPDQQNNFIKQHAALANDEAIGELLGLLKPMGIPVARTLTPPLVAQAAATMPVAESATPEPPTEVALVNEQALIDAPATLAPLPIDEPATLEPLTEVPLASEPPVTDEHVPLSIDTAFVPVPPTQAPPASEPPLTAALPVAAVSEPPTQAPLASEAPVTDEHVPLSIDTAFVAEPPTEVPLATEPPVSDEPVMPPVPLPIDAAVVAEPPTEAPLANEPPPPIAPEIPEVLASADPNSAPQPEDLPEFPMQPPQENQQ